MYMIKIVRKVKVESWRNLNLLVIKGHMQNQSMQMISSSEHGQH